MSVEGENPTNRSLGRLMLFSSKAGYCSRLQYLKTKIADQVLVSYVGRKQDRDHNEVRGQESCAKNAATTGFDGGC